MSERVICPKPKKEEMCENCGGKISPGKITVKHWYDGRLSIIEDVPVGICQFCSERYYEADTVDKLDIIAKEKGARPREPAKVVSFVTVFANQQPGFDTLRTQPKG
jgi:YgiT-type zinc finger domain-containing protein